MLPLFFFTQQLMSCLFNFTRSFSFQTFISEPAAQTVLPVAIFLLKLKQSLWVGRSINGKSGSTPQTGDMIVLGFQCFKKTSGTVTKPFICSVHSVSIQKRDNGVDKNKVQSILSQTLFLMGRAFFKRKMCLPIGRSPCGYYLLYIFRSFGRHNSWKQRLFLMIQPGKLCQAHMGEIAGTQT